MPCKMQFTGREEKFRQAGRQCLCLPWLRWLHRFGRPMGVPYPLTLEDRLHNYLIGWRELGLPLDSIYAHFLECMPASAITRVASEALGRHVSIRIHEEDEGMRIARPEPFLRAV